MRPIKLTADELAAMTPAELEAKALAIVTRDQPIGFAPILLAEATFLLTLATNRRLAGAHRTDHSADPEVTV